MKIWDSVYLCLVSTTCLNLVYISRADEMDEYDATPHSTTEKFILPTAPRAARGPDASDERIPRDPVNTTDTI